jgi:hypothetical protein
VNNALAKIQLLTESRENRPNVQDKELLFLLATSLLHLHSAALTLRAMQVVMIDDLPMHQFENSKV